MDEKYRAFYIRKLKYNLRPFMLLSEDEQQVLRSLPDNLQVMTCHGGWKTKILDAYYNGEIYRVEPLFEETQ